MIKDRFDIIRTYVKGKHVLDLGCVDHDEKNQSDPSWLHRLIKKEAKSLLGVDIEKKEVEKLKKKGFDAVYGNFEVLDLKRRFDVIVAGNIIEHLFNQGLFLDNVSKHLAKDGVFVLTTDNCFGFRHWFYAFLFGKVPVNGTHTCYYDIETLTYLLKCKGFVVEKKYFYTDSRGIRYIVERIFGIRDVLCPYMLLILKKN